MAAKLSFQSNLEFTGFNRSNHNAGRPGTRLSQFNKFLRKQHVNMAVAFVVKNYDSLVSHMILAIFLHIGGLVRVVQTPEILRASFKDKQD